MKKFLKLVPGIVPVVRFLRAQHKTAIELVTKAYLSRLKIYTWSVVHFDTLEAPLAVSNHAKENYLVYTSDKVIGKLLYCRGDFDLQKFQRAMHILNLEANNNAPTKKPILFDIGANVGSIGIPAIKRGYVDHVIAFEPDPDNFRLLRINSILNGVDDRMDCHQVALGAETSIAELKKSVDNYGDHRIQTLSNKTGNTEFNIEPDVATVKVCKLDDFLVDTTEYILWIDVQGYEAHVLSGATAALRNAYPLILEFTPKDLVENGTMDKFLDHLTSTSYTQFFNLESSSPVGIDLNRENILTLARELEMHDNFTDILVL